MYISKTLSPCFTGNIKRHFDNNPAQKTTTGTSFDKIMSEVNSSAPDWYYAIESLPTDEFAACLGCVAPAGKQNKINSEAFYNGLLDMSLFKFQQYIKSLFHNTSIQGNPNLDKKTEVALDCVSTDGDVYVRQSNETANDINLKNIPMESLVQKAEDVRDADIAQTKKINGESNIDSTEGNSSVSKDINDVTASASKTFTDNLGDQNISIKSIILLKDGEYATLYTEKDSIIMQDSSGLRTKVAIIKTEAGKIFQIVQLDDDNDIASDIELSEKGRPVNMFFRKKPVSFRKMFDDAAFIVKNSREEFSNDFDFDTAEKIISIANARRK